MTKIEPLVEQADEAGYQDHVIHMWQPLRFQTKRGYDYRRRALYKRAGTALLRTFAFVILQLYTRVVLGFRVSGQQNLKALGKEGAATVCNHVHMLDCAMIDMTLYPHKTHYITLESNFRIPFIRHLIRIFGGVPLSENPVRLAELFREMGRAADDGALVHIYPEGVLIPYCETLRPFKSGAFRFVAKKRLPVLPMVLVQRRPRGLFRLYKRKPCWTLHILPPQYPDGALADKPAAEALERTCRAAMVSCLREHADPAAAQGWESSENKPSGRGK